RVVVHDQDFNVLSIHGAQCTLAIYGGHDTETDSNRLAHFGVEPGFGAGACAVRQAGPALCIRPGPCVPRISGTRSRARAVAAAAWRCRVRRSGVGEGIPRYGGRHARRPLPLFLASPGWLAAAR